MMSLSNKNKSTELKLWGLFNIKTFLNERDHVCFVDLITASLCIKG